MSAGNIRTSALLVDASMVVLFMFCASCSIGLRNGVACYIYVLLYFSIIVVFLSEFWKYPPNALLADTMMLVLFLFSASGSIGCVTALHVISFCTSS